MPPRDWVMTCPYCSASPAVFEPQVEFASRSRDGMPFNWKAATCPACGCAIVAVVVQEGRDWRVVEVFPKEVGKWEVGDLPESVKPSWDEAIKVYRAGAHASAVVMCGRTLESAADARGISTGTLAKRVEEMLAEGLITAEFKGAINYARLMRNIGAHAGQPVSPESAEGAMSFTQQTLRLLFEVPAQLDRLTAPKPEELDGNEGEGVDGG